MPPSFDSSTATSTGDSSGSLSKGRVDYVIEGRILIATATGPFNQELIAAIPGAISGMITNFHLAKSTLLMLVSALAGSENIKIAYAEAIKKQYRFYSYGDAMLIV